MKSAVVICPGRGTYNKEELGYLGHYFHDANLLTAFDEIRQSAGQDTLTQLDQADRFLLSRHTRGDNASGLIYAATLGDFASISRDEIDIVAVTGNSMGWYSALACGGALSAVDGFTVANTMGTFMQDALIGGQLVYPFVDEDWHPDPERKKALLHQVAEINSHPDQTLSLSIDLGGMLVLAGDEAGLAAFEQIAEPVQGRFPMRLGNHAAFHTALQEPVAQRGREALPPHLFGQPTVPLLDGRGSIWWPHSTDTDELWNYTLGHQVTQPYDFTRAITIAAREFAPDYFIITGPGTTLGGGVAQSLILANWHDMQSKEDFKRAQANDPFLVSMGREDQRGLVC